MRAVTCLLTFAIAFGACGDGTPQEVTTFKVGPDGRPVKGTERQEVVVDRQALLSHDLAYTWDCTTEAPFNIFGGEEKVRLWGDWWTSGNPCLGFGLGGNRALGIGFDGFMYPGHTWFIGNQVRSHITKASDHAPTHHVNSTHYKNFQAGGGHPIYTNGETAAFTALPPGFAYARSFNEWDRPGSFQLVRHCNAAENPSC
jgi:hypothetical protein